jgi:beta-barrel assembly-enhancing protease
VGIGYWHKAVQPRRAWRRYKDMRHQAQEHNRSTGQRTRRSAPLSVGLAVAVLTVGAVGCMASTQEEVAMGSQYAAEINRQLPIISDPEITRYITVLGDSIARVADTRNLDWHFYVVDQAEINAFAVPGGYIYVNRGLIERAETLSELAGVLGHEIGHVTQRHSMEQMAKANQANVGLTIGCILAPAVCQSGLGSAAVQIGAGGLFAKFSRDDEREADRVGIDYVVRAGLDPRGIPTMFRTLLAERQRRPDALEGMFSTHPLAEDRVAETEAVIATIDPVILQSLTKDTRAFQQFKARLKSMPPSPTSGGR